MPDTRLALDDGSLVDVLDRLITTGVAIDGCLVISLAGVDLARLDLKAVLAAVRGHQPIAPAPGHQPIAPAPRFAARLPALRPLHGPQAGLAGLVLLVTDLLRQLLERLALRRMDAGELSADQVERLGRALMSLEEQSRALGRALSAGRQRERSSR